MQSVRRVVQATVLGVAAAAVVASPAMATTNTDGGDATTNIKYTNTLFTSNGSGISVRYNNGIGAGGNNRLYLRVCKSSGGSSRDCSANSAVGVTNTGQTYQLGNLPRGTKFVIQYRAASSPGLNTYWSGAFTY